MTHVFLKYLLCLAFYGLVVSCNSHKKTIEKEEKELRSLHETKLKLIRAGFDPIRNKVPDSMKKWINVFANVLADDQQYRIIGVQMKDSELAAQRKLDSLNLIIVCNFLDKYGWPALPDAGFVSQRAINAVIQHAPPKIQEKYYPKLIETFQRDPSLFETVAMMEDRINQRNKRPQYYGTQIVYVEGKPVVYPLVSVDSLEAFRNRLGKFIPYDQYLSIFKMKWNPAEYKNQLPGLKAKLKVSDSVGINHFVRHKNYLSE